MAWRLAGRRVVVIGGGEVAEQKVTGLLDAGAELILVAPEVVPRLACLADAGTLTWM
ncbi:MAG: NAD(P)-dependent oxidoreductase, partial [Actinomycetota bacterium]|nr:NAD(P)-dependent oxidoreductase [Actinomycetota bacterium]